MVAMLLAQAGFVTAIQKLLALGWFGADGEALSIGPITTKR